MCWELHALGKKNAHDHCVICFYVENSTYIYSTTLGIYMYSCMQMIENNLEAKQSGLEYLLLIRLDCRLLCSSVVIMV